LNLLIGLSALPLAAVFVGLIWSGLVGESDRRQILAARLASDLAQQLEQSVQAATEIADLASTAFGLESSARAACALVERSMQQRLPVGSAFAAIDRRGVNECESSVDGGDWLGRWSIIDPSIWVASKHDVTTEGLPSVATSPSLVLTHPLPSGSGILERLIGVRVPLDRSIHEFRRTHSAEVAAAALIDAHGRLLALSAGPDDRVEPSALQRLTPNADRASSVSIAWWTGTDRIVARHSLSADERLQVLVGVHAASPREILAAAFPPALWMAGVASFLAAWAIQSIVRRKILASTDELAEAVSRLQLGYADGYGSEAGKSGEFVRIARAMSTLSDRLRRTDEDLRDSESRFQFMAEHANDLVLSLGLDGTVRQATPACRRLIGYGVDDLIGRSIYDFVYRDDLKPARQLHEDALSAGESSATFRMRRREGGSRTLEATAKALRPADGRPAEEIILVARDVSDRAEHQRELDEAMQAASKANTAQSAFLSHVSHELRTPLNAIIGLSQIIRDQMFGPVGAPRYVEYARDIEISGQNLLDLINDLLDLSKLEAGRWDLDERVVSLDRSIDAVATMMTERARAAQTRLDVELADGLPLLRGDERAIRQVLSNLVSTLIRAGGAGGRVLISASVEAGAPTIVVSAILAASARPKSGQAAQISRLGSGPLSPRNPVTALSRALVAGLMELHGGHLHVSEPEGTKVAITLTFPASRSLGTTGGVAARAAAG
jgi:PAS domain S-box-containing protein